MDRAAVNAALSFGIRVAGWCPAGRVADDGPIPVRYLLHETPTGPYGHRATP